MREAVIVEAVRTPVGKRNGGLSGVHAADLSAVVLNASSTGPGWTLDRRRRGVGLRVPGGRPVQQHRPVLGARRGLAGVDSGHDGEPGLRVQPAGAGLRGAGRDGGQQDVVVAGGVEVMSRVPLGSARATGMPYGPKVQRYEDFSFNQGISAEMIAEKWGFSRTRLDEYSARSHELAAAAQDRGAFTDQIVAVPPTAVSSPPTRASGAAPRPRSSPRSSRPSPMTA
jgi:acetyl-CoA acyltransferase